MKIYQMNIKNWLILLILEAEKKYCKMVLAMENEFFIL